MQPDIFFIISISTGLCSGSVSSLAPKIELN